MHNDKGAAYNIDKNFNSVFSYNSDNAKHSS
jgi:hypothetical protein